jgi:hypothetical protein
VKRSEFFERAARPRGAARRRDEISRALPSSSNSTDNAAASPAARPQTMAAESNGTV